jgi:hypothetical protein
MDTGAKVLPEVALTQSDFDALNEYSCTLPTGTMIGTRWKCGRPYHGLRTAWYLGEYVPCDLPGQVGIRWRRIRVISDANELLIHERLYGRCT